METNDRPKKRVMRGAMDTGCAMWAPIIPPSEVSQARSSAAITSSDSPDAVLVPDVISLKVLKEI